MLYEGESASFWAYGMNYVEETVYVLEGTDANMTTTPEAYSSRILRYDLAEQTMETVSEREHSFLYGQFEMGIQGIYSRLEYSHEKGILSLQLQDIAGDILREEVIPVTNDTRTYRSWGCYGVTEDCALYWLEWDNLTGTSRMGAGLLRVPLQPEEEAQWLLEVNL